MEETFQETQNDNRYGNSTKNKRLDAVAVQTAAWKWVRSFNWIPQGVVAKLKQSGDSIIEITPPTAVRYKRSGSFLPICSKMYSFSHPKDNQWLNNPANLQKMADCGFRIYKQDDYGFIFGIDGAGYDFYVLHWIPLYKARGLWWHS